jgi:hypothetical protein
MAAKMYIQIYMMHSSKLNHSYSEQRGAICARQTGTTTNIIAQQASNKEM